MPKSTELEIIRKQLTEAKLLHAEAEQARATIEVADRTELEKAWQCGKRLNFLKDQLPHGEWETWISSNWPELAGSTRRLYMKIDNDNPNCQRVGDLKHDSIRKYAIANVPKKTHPPQAGDESFSKSTHHSAVVNDLARMIQRIEAGQDDADEDELRRDFRPAYDWLRKLFGDA
jgi:hypothetical protein